MDFREIDRILQAEFASKKVAAENLAAENLKKVQANPAYKKMDAIERQLVFEISKCKSKNDSYKNMKQNLEFVRKEKEKILTGFGLKQVDLKPNYSCQMCQDSGFVLGKPCECYKKRKNIELIKAFGLSASKECSFECFDVSICKYS